MSQKDEFAEAKAIFVFFFIGIVFGCFLGAWIDRSYTTHLHWKELVQRGYAEEVETSLGVGYRWKDK